MTFPGESGTIAYYCEEPMPMLDGEYFDVAVVLAPVRQRLGWRRVQRGALQGLGVGAVLGTIILLVSRLVEMPRALPLALSAVAASTLACALYGRRQWPDADETAHLVDLRLGLQDRMATALEHRFSQDALSVVQRRDVRNALVHAPLAQTARGQIRWQHAALSGLPVAALFAALLLGGGPSPRQSFAQSSRDAQRIHRVAATDLPALLKRLRHELTPVQRRDPRVRTLSQTLQTLRHQLTRTSTTPDALRTVSAAQQALDRSRAQLQRLDERSLEQLNRYLTPAERASASADGATRAAVTERALNRLSRTLNQMPAAQRAGLARSLDSAARLSRDRQLSTALHQASSSLARGDRQSAASALQQSSNNVARQGQSQELRDLLGKASTGLDYFKNRLTFDAPKRQSSRAGAARSTGKHGKPTARGQSSGAKTQAANGHEGEQSSGNARTSRTGSGTSKQAGSLASGDPRLRKGLIHGQTTTKSGRASQFTAGRGSAGGNGGSGAGNKTSSAAGRKVTVYVTGREGHGPHTVQIESGHALGHAGRLVPYQIVIGHYRNIAHTSLGRSALPPDLQTDVRRYFSSISQ